jgi:predicted DNA-binding protein
MNSLMFTLRMSIATARRLDALAQTDFGGASRSAIIRMAVDRFLEDADSIRMPHTREDDDDI